MIKPSEEEKGSKRHSLHHSDDGWDKKKDRKEVEEKINIIRYSFFLLLFQSSSKSKTMKREKKRKIKGLDHGSLVHRSQRIHFPSGAERNYIDRHTHTHTK